MVETVEIKEKKNFLVQKKKSFQMRDVFFTIVYGEKSNDYDSFVNREFNKVSQDMIKIGSPKALKILLDLHEKYPNIPEAINNIAACYQSQQKMDKVEEFLEKLNRICPDYLFARTARATKAIIEGRAEDVPSIFNNCFNLKDLYPARDEFHVTEVIAFSYVMGLYFCVIKDIKTAQIYYDFLVELADKDDKRVESLGFRIAMVRMFSFTDKPKTRGIKKKKSI